MSGLSFVHKFIPAPAGAESGRALLLLHGTGGDENDLLDLGRALDPDAALLSPRGNVLENGAPRFFRRLAEGVFDEEDVRTRAGELAGFINAAITQYEINGSNLVAMGYSNGANIAAAMMLLGLAPFMKAILLRAMVPLSNVEPVSLKGSRALISAGQFDPIAQPRIAQNLAELLRTSGAEVDFVLQPSGHELSPADIETARQWLASYR
jgi:phospholipase/carboxylesterase